MKETADLLKQYRLFPRIFSLIFLYLLYDVADWFMQLQVPSTEQAGFAATMVATAAAWFKFYVDGAREQ